jgi:hypothetical protein
LQISFDTYNQLKIKEKKVPESDDWNEENGSEQQKMND